MLDELHALVTSKRGDLLSLGLARLWQLAPQMRAIGLSATVAEPELLARFLVPQRDGKSEAADIVVAGGAAAPIVEMLDTRERLPWAGHSARHALPEVYELIKANKTTLVFVNTRSQAEMLFQDLWRMNDDGLAIALHHGSLDVAQRRKVEDAMAAGKLRGVVCTSSLDLGVDWGDVDLVINIGAPKGASRLMQRIGRANHRIDEASRAVLVPANRFEVLECAVAIDAVNENAQDTPPLRIGALDVLAQHVLGRACGAPFLSDELFDEVRTAAPYAALARSDFDDVVDFVATGGYALKTYERFARIKQDKQGRWRVANPRVRQSYRLNVGTIVEESMLKVRLVRSRGGGSGSTGALGRGGRMLGEIEEYFIEGLVVGDTFVFGGEVVRYEALAEDQVYVSRANDKDAKVPSYMGGKFPLSTYLAERVRNLLADKRAWSALPDQVRDWLSLQADLSRVPGASELVVETFPRADKHYLVCYPFEGRLAHQTLGMLLTRRLERARARPLGFVANEYALAVWSLGDMSFMIRQGKLDLDALFDPDMLGDDLEAWLAESALMKRTFRTCAIISGLIARRFTGEEKTRRQVLFSTDLIYDVLRKHQPDHVLLRAARADAATGLLDIRRLSDMLTRIKGRITHRELDANIAARGAGDAGNRPRSGLWRGLRRVAGGSRQGTGQGSDWIKGDWTDRDGTRAIPGRRTIRCAHLDRRCRGRDVGRRSLRRAVLGRTAPARRLRPASGKGLQLRRARRAAAALRYGSDTRPPQRGDRAARPAHGDRARRQFSRPRGARPAVGGGPRRHRRPASPPRLDLDFRQSRPGVAARSRRRGRQRSRDRQNRIPPRADRRGR